MSDNITNNYNSYPWRDGDWIDVTKEGNKYRFLEDSLLGSGGYRNGLYIVPHKREDANDLNLRKSKAYYSNQYRPIWQAHHKPIFKNTAVRKTKEGIPLSYQSVLDVFLQDVNAKGDGIQSFMEQSAGATKNLGASFIVVNNDKDISASIEDVINDRSGVPYAFMVTPDMIHSYTQDSFGNLTELKWWQQADSVEFNQYGQPSVELGSSIRSNPIDMVVVGVNDESWVVYEEDGTTLIDAFPNEIGVLPVIRLVAEPSDDVIPESSLYGVARIQHRIYNLASIITDIQDNQGFSILTMPMHADAGVDYGTTKGLGYPSDSSRSPEFISPDAQQLKTLLEGYNSLINEMYQAGVVSHLQRFQQSAESKEIDRARLNDLLGTFKKQIEQAEEQLVYLFGLYVGYDYEYSVRYSDDFGVSTLTEQTDIFLKLKGAGISQSLATELEKELASNLIEFESDEDMGALLERIETERDVSIQQTSIESQF